MIPEFNTDRIEDFVEFYSSVVRNLEHMSQGHLSWYTHKNPFGCWICDLFKVVNKLLQELTPIEMDTPNRSKSVLENMNDCVQDKSQDSKSRECDD